MTEEMNVWDSDKETVYDEYPSEKHTTFVRVNGSEIELEPGMPFVSIKKVASEARLGKFRVFPIAGLDNVPLTEFGDISPDQSPDMIEEGMQMELRPYDKAGK